MDTVSGVEFEVCMGLCARYRVCKEGERGGKLFAFSH
jgi:hypothetical protein